MTPLDQAIAATTTATHPEAVIHNAMTALFPHLGDCTAHLAPGALADGQQQFFVCGGFFVAPDRQHQMLVGNTGFPPDQRRLLVPIDGGHPGVVIATGQPLLLTDTRQHGAIRQYLRTSRMGSAIYAPLVWDGAAQGMVIMAAQAAGTMRQADLDTLAALAPHVAARWLQTGGSAWLATEYTALRQDPPPA